MMRFMKIGEEEEGMKQLNAKDALLMWVNNKATHSKYLYLIVLL